MGQVVEDLPASSGKQRKLPTGIAAAKNIQLIKICVMSDGCAERPVVRKRSEVVTLGAHLKNRGL